MVNSLNKVPVAIIGMASIVPQAKNLQGYWDNIFHKLDCVTDVPLSRWDPTKYFDPNPNAQDKTYCKRGGFIPDIDFDPAEFGLPPNILEVTDVSQLLGLVVARDALVDAGYGEANPKQRETTGVILGFNGTSSKLFTPLMSRLQYPVWEKALKTSGLSDADTQKIIGKIKASYVNWEENSFPGVLGNVVAGRIANRFDLGGTNCVIDAACASSMAAIRMSVSELIEGHADMMITGGVDTDNSINTYMCFSKTPAFSKSEYPRPFDAESDGMMVGEGLGMVILKRLVDAERDNDRIYAVIRGIGTSSDGRYKSIYAPRPAGQVKALRRAYEEAGFPPTSVGLIEAHGTGTVAGDPAEFQGLKEVFIDENLKTNGPTIALGSVKSQIAHTKAMAGTASLIKTALALHHKILPATIHVNQPNPKLGIEETPFYINTETRPWFQPKDGTPRRAGVSSFGFGGTNFHIVLEEYRPEPAGAYRMHLTPDSILLAAPDPAQLIAICRKTMSDLSSPEAEQVFLNLVANSSDLLPKNHDARIGFVADGKNEAIEYLKMGLESLETKPDDEAWENPKGIYYRKNGLETDGKVVATFSGQGSQYVDMGRDLASNFPEIRQVFQEMDALFTKDGKRPLSRIIYPQPAFTRVEKDSQEKQLQSTEYAQPAIGVFGASLYKLLRAAGFKADFTAGHSFGELTALWAAGVITEEDYFHLAKARGKAMAPPDDLTFDAGSMLAVKGRGEEVSEAIKDFPEITLANWNSNNQVVLAGPKTAITQVQSHLCNKGFSVLLLPVSAAFHTPLVGHAQKPFAAAIASVKFKKPEIPVFSNSTGKKYPSEPKEIQNTLTQHILKPVLFRDEIESIYLEGGRIFVEFGPKAVITGLVKSTLGDRPHLAIALNSTPKKDSDRQLREAIIALRVAGLPIHNFDPYRFIPKPVTKKKSGINIVLNGGLYVSEKTRLTEERAMNDGFRVATQSPAMVPSNIPVNPILSEPFQTAKVNPFNPSETPSKNGHETSPLDPVGGDTPNGFRPGASLEGFLTNFMAHQNNLAHAHEQYLANENEYTLAFSQISQQETTLVSNAANHPETLEQINTALQTIEQSLAKFHEHQAETAHVHESYLQSQMEISQAMINIIQGNTGIIGHQGTTNLSAKPVVKAPAPVNNLPVISLENNGENQNKVSHPIETATPQDEARKTTHPLQPEKLPAIRMESEDSSQPPPAYISTDAIAKTLLEVVSEKTGYPAEMLEPGMDMEADLGIDSIKRVEILGAMQERFPQLPKIDPEALAELRTLSQITEHLGQGVSSLLPAPQVEARPMVSQPLASETVISQPAAAPLSIDEISRSLLEVVSEKTGYPAEMLEPGMDMEADLGIDSIKRVEILGAMQERFPQLPKIDPEALAELRTLGQITEHLGQGVSSLLPAPPVEVRPIVSQPLEPESVTSQPDGGLLGIVEISRSLLEVVSEKTGYPAEMLEPGMDMEADLGIDSIKRVEILGAMQERFPQLPKIDPEALAELRTLGQITEHLGKGTSDPIKDPQIEANHEVTVLPVNSPINLEHATGINFEILSEKLLEETSTSISTIQQGLVSLETLPAPDLLSFSLEPGTTCLITDDGSSTTTELAEALIGEGMPVAILNFPKELVQIQSQLPSSVQRFSMESSSEEDLVKTLKEIQSSCGPVRVFIHLSPTPDEIHPSSNGSGVAFLHTEKALVKLVFLIAKHLKQDLNQGNIEGRTAFIAVTHLDGEFGLGQTGNNYPTNGGLFGLVKTLNLEWEPVFCRAIDLDPHLEATFSAQVILAELHDPNRLITEVGYNSHGRSTLVLSNQVYR